MKTEERYALILSLITHLYNKGSWCGETHIQKTTYFLEVLQRVPSSMDFTLYKHGPYSFELHDILGDMLNLGYIEQEQRPPYGPRLRLTGTGKDFLERQKGISVHTQAINAVASKFCAYSVQGLERVSTALLLKKQHSDYNASALAQKLHSIKPHIPLSEAQKAVQEMEALCAS